MSDWARSGRWPASRVQPIASDHCLDARVNRRSLPIIAGRKTEQLKENIAALDITLSGDQMERLNTAGNPRSKQGLDPADLKRGQNIFQERTVEPQIPPRQGRDRSVSSRGFVQGTTLVGP